jgi:hypothetical protein
MTSWEERVGSSPAWQAAESAQRGLAQLRDSHGFEDVLGRPARLVEIAVARLRALDPELAVPSALEDLAQRLQQMMAALSGHLEPAEGQTVTEVDAIIDAADRAAQALNSLPVGGDEEAVALADVYRREIGDVEAKVADLVEGAQTAIATSTEEHTRVLEARKDDASQLTDQLTELKSQIDALKATVEEFLSERRTAAEAAATEAKAVHDTQREQASQTTEALLTTARESFDTEATRQREAHGQLIESLGDEAKRHLAEIEEMKGQVERLVGAVGRTGLSGGFQQWEASERQQADKMRSYAIGLGISAAVAVVGLVVVRLTIGESGDDLVLSLGALSIPAALGGVAVYAGRESGRHRRNQIIARRTELELASFGPYIAELDDDEQAEITALFAPVFFGQSTAHTATSKVDEHSGPQPLTKEVLDRLTELVKNRRSTAP